MPTISNEDQLRKLMEQKVENALERITKEVLEKFRKDYILKYVYNSHGANKMYLGGSGKPSYEFLNAWQFSEVKKQLNILSTELWYNFGNMSYDNSTFLHGSKYSSPNDVRDNLMDILNKKGYSSSLWLSVSRSVPYWDKFLEDMFQGGQLDKIISKHFSREGFIKV